MVEKNELHALTIQVALLNERFSSIEKSLNKVTGDHEERIKSNEHSLGAVVLDVARLRERTTTFNLLQAVLTAVGSSLVYWLARLP